MGLFNDVRFYLMAALAVLFLLVVAMCSTAYDADPDGHADSGVKHETTTAGAGANTEEAQTETTAAVAEPVKAAEPVTAVAEVKEEVEEVAQVEEVVEAETAVETATESEGAEATATETEGTEATTTEAEGTEATATETTAETTTMEINREPFELAPLATSGEIIPDFGTDLGNLKVDMSKYSGRVDGTTGLLGAVKEVLQ